MLPRAHLPIDKRIRSIDAEAGDVYVVIDESLRIDIVERALHEVGGL